MRAASPPCSRARGRRRPPRMPRRPAPENLLWRDDKIAAFDALEFDRKLREIDVISETAFLAMDLHAHGRADLEHGLLNRYLEAGGDYDGDRGAALLSRLPRARARQGCARSSALSRRRASTTRSATSLRRRAGRAQAGRCSSSLMACRAAAKPRDGRARGPLARHSRPLRPRAQTPARARGVCALGLGARHGPLSTAASRRTYAAARPR